MKKSRFTEGKAVEQYALRRACRLVGLSRDSYRHPPETDQETAALSAAIIEIAQACRRFNYRRINDLLSPEFPNVNHKRIHRLYSAANLPVRKCRKAKRPTTARVPLQINSVDPYSLDRLELARTDIHSPREYRSASHQTNIGPSVPTRTVSKNGASGRTREKRKMNNPFSAKMTNVAAATSLIGRRTNRGTGTRGTRVKNTLPIISQRALLE